MYLASSLYEAGLAFLQNCRHITFNAWYDNYIITTIAISCAVKIYIY